MGIKDVEICDDIPREECRETNAFVPVRTCEQIVNNSEILTIRESVQPQTQVNSGSLNSKTDEELLLELEEIKRELEERIQRTDLASKVSNLLLRNVVL